MKTNTPTKQLGYDFAEGVIECLAKYIVLVYVILIVFALTRNWLELGTDDSDKNGFQRSGLRVHTDALTGIQYLSDGHGGLVRREYHSNP